MRAGASSFHGAILTAVTAAAGAEPLLVCQPGLCGEPALQGVDECQRGEAVLASCPSFAMEIFAAAEGESAAAEEITPTVGGDIGVQSGPQPEGHPLDLYDSNGNGRIICAEARERGIAPVRSAHPARQCMRAPDADGAVCE